MPQTTSDDKAPERKGSFCDFSTRSYLEDELSLRLIATLEAPKVETVFRDLYFEGGTVLACKTGGFSLGFKNGETVKLSPGEVLVVYPGNVVTIRSLKAGSHLNYVVFKGTKTGDFLGDFGFYDKLHFKADIQDETFMSILRASEAGMHKEEVLSHVTDALRTFQQALRQAYGTLVNDAVRTIHRNLAQGIVGIKPVCDVLNVSRSHLNGLFVRTGLGNPAAFIRREQLDIACRLLRTTSLPIVDIGKSVGITSPIYFSSFIRRLTGRTPTEIRTKGYL